MGQRATVSGSATFANVEVDPELVIAYHEASRCPSSSGPARSSFTPRSRSGSPAAPFEMPASSCATGRALSSRPRGRDGPTAPATIHIRSNAMGELATQVRAAEALLAQAAATQQEIGRRPRDAEAAARGSIAVAQAKAFASEVAVEVASDLFALSGASAPTRAMTSTATGATPAPMRAMTRLTGNTTTSAITCSTKRCPQPRTTVTIAETRLDAADTGICAARVRRASVISPPG